MYLFRLSTFFTTLFIVCYGACPSRPLFAFIENTTVAQTISISGTYSLVQDPTDYSNITPGSYVLLACNSGYTLSSGQLNITCIGNAWTTFPTCTMMSTSSTMNNNTLLSNNNVPCVFNQTMFNINNGYLSNVLLSYISSNTATGWVQFACATGYTNIGGNLNVTCSSSGSWSPFPNCVLNTGGGGSLTTPTMSNNNGQSCTFNTTMLNITNGYSSNASILYTSNNTAAGKHMTLMLRNNPIEYVIGWVQFACLPGYALDPTVGSLYVCSNGAWSTQPRCLMTGRCSFSTLQSFISNATGLMTTGQSQLLQLPQNTSVVLGGSYIVFACNTGYTNTGGSLNVTCSSSSSWSPFPTCVLNTGGGGSLTTTTMSNNNNGLPCAFDGTTLNIMNGYLFNISLTYTSSNTATGWLQFACVPGYALDSTVGNLYVCNNGVWSTKPRCLTTGGCSLSTFQSFILNATGLINTGPSQLIQTPQNTSYVLNGSYAVFTCMSGYTNIGGSLNVTCSSNNTWSPFPSCVLNTGGGSLTTTTTMSNNNGLPCAFDGTTLNIMNGYSPNVSLSYTSSNTATGWVQFACVPGYALDSTVGNLYVCNNGVWSTKPRCLTTGGCSFSTLQSFASNATGLMTTGQSQLMQLAQNTSVVLSGSYIVFACITGYTNTGGSLNVTCSSNSTWSPFPSCVLNTGGGSLTTTTTMSNNNGLPCAFDGTTLTIMNGYSPNVSLSYTSSNTATGWVQFACIPGYALDSTVGNLYVCNNGVWSTKPRCLTTGGCSFLTLQSFVSNATGIMATGQSQLMQPPQNTSVILSGSYIVFACITGYTNTGGSLNVTCSSSSSWSPFPTCVLNTGGGGSLTTTTMSNNNNGLPCAFDGTTLNIMNGYSPNVSLSYTSSNTATGWVQFACVPGYALDATVGNLYICNNGVWSTKPRCLTIGGCSFLTLQSFVSNATGLMATGQSQLMQLAQNTSVILSGSYIVFACITGYTNTGGSLNVTCSSSSSWSPFPTCVLNTGGGGSLTTTTMPNNNGLSCAFDTTTLNIMNGYSPNVSLTYTSSNTATGWVQFACVPGYALDATVGNLYICNNGVWSTKPRCLTIGGCSFLTLQSFVSNATGLMATGQSQLMQLAQNTSVILSGSYIVFACITGYTNTGGSLNVTCSSSSSWSPFPTCVLNTGGGGSLTTTTMPNNNGLSCAFDTTTLNIMNGYVFNVSLTYTSSNTATGRVQFACLPGYALDSTVGNLYVCNNGVWSTKPRCLTTGGCSFSTLQSFVSNATGIMATGQSQLMQLPQNTSVILSGSYIVFACITGYTNTGGNLNVTCSSSGAWSQYPNCVPNTQTTIVPSNSGATCTYSSSLLSIANGYASSWTGVMTPTAIQALSGASITYMCTPPYNLVGNSVMTCNNGVWSAQPVCLANSATTVKHSSNCDYVPNVANSYISMATPIQFINNQYQRKIQFACNPGYAFTSTSGQSLVSCLNGVWDPLPVCALSPSCSASQLQSALVNVQLVLNSLQAGNGGFLAGGWILLQCASGFTRNPLSGSLNVTCLSTGTWSVFPVCS
ncbi:unnamed protein product [Rotaria socialis]